MGDYKQFFSGKKITLMGLGLLGRGVGDAKFLARYCKELVVTDLKTAKELESSVAKLRKFKNIKFVLGRHRLADFRDRDLIIKAAGVSLESIYLSEAKKHKIPVRMSTALFAKFAMESGARIIGVTGTRGKSTTTQLIYEILKVKYTRVFLGGNVLGLSTLALLPRVRKGDLVVLELDSWQLQGFGQLKISPGVAVFTNFLPDHLNYYSGSMARYFSDKANIFLYQKSGDKLFWGGKVPEMPQDWKTKLPGDHSYRNIALAVAVAKLLEVPTRTIKKVVESFTGVSGRLELIKTWRGIRIYNDTTATTPDATLVALRALSRNRKLVLIMGGADKGLDMVELLGNLSRFCKQVILLPGTGTDKIKNKVKNVILVENVDEAIKKALTSCERDDILLFSPGFASFGLFRNEYDRGEKFLTAVARSTQAITS